MRNRCVTIFCMLLLAGCANPVNRATSDRYAVTCSEAQMKGQLDVAEQACYRALVNVDWGNLEGEVKSQRLFNLALVKRRLAKFQEAEELLKQSLAIEEKLGSPSQLRITKREVELAVNLAALGRWEEGAKVLDRMVAPEGLQPQERRFAADVLRRYAAELGKRKEPEISARLETRAEDLARVDR